MQKFSVLLIILFTIMFFMTSCGEDEVPVEEIIENKWIEDTSFFRESRILLNSGISDDKLIIVGLNHYSIFENDYKYESIQHYSWAPRSFDHKPLIHNKKMIVTHAINTSEYNQDFSLQSPLFGAGGSKVKDFFDLNKISAEYSENSHMSFLKYYTVEFGAFNNQNQFLVVMNDEDVSENNEYKYHTSFALIDLNITSDDDFPTAQHYLIMDPKIKKIEVPHNYGTRVPYLMYSFNGYFFVAFQRSTSSNVGSLWRISPNGEILELLNYNDTPSKMFAFDNILYRLDNQKIHRSLDNGLTWEYAAPAPFQFDRAGFFEVDGVLYCHITSQIFIVNMSPDATEWKELDNSGLERTEITSVTEFQDRVYVTTLSGLFYKSTEDFLKLKEAELKE